MAKSRAEIQRAYRERQKAKNNEEYLKKERERRRRNYVPSAQLSRRDRIRRNVKNNETLKRHRRRRKEEARLAAEAAEAAIENQRIGENMDSSGYDSPGSQAGPSNLIVRLPFNNRRNGSRKRISRSLSKKAKELSKLRTQFHGLNRKHRTTLRKFQRLKKKLVEKSPKSPRSQTEKQIREARLNEEQGRKVRRQLLLGNYCSQWRQEHTSLDDAESPQENVERPSEPCLRDDQREGSDLSTGPEVYNVDDFVVAFYEGTWYIGKILEVDPADESGYIYLISFMKRMKKTF
ncbi:uncharacterized protein LOC135464917 [Liolophura sinensis]|uniref:uncharacterized protein LOC135464917 n=1 Tax=Liolophura sinensis TaxID=3198878 RepID=UPI0031581706